MYKASYRLIPGRSMGQGASGMVERPTPAHLINTELNFDQNGRGFVFHYWFLTVLQSFIQNFIRIHNTVLVRGARLSSRWLPRKKIEVERSVPYVAPAHGLQSKL